MTDDTLRQECEALIFQLALLHRTDNPVDTILAFARAQQAAGLREAAVIASKVGKGRFTFAESAARLDIVTAIEAQATAREQMNDSI